MSHRVYLLGGFQTDFAQNYSRAGKNLYDMMRESVEGALAATFIGPSEEALYRSIPVAG
jgi:acetyl-CoA C-acetyltransferase